MAKTNKRTYELYVHTNKVNGKKYVGISQDSELRWGYVWKWGEFVE